MKVVYDCVEPSLPASFPDVLSSNGNTDIAMACLRLLQIANSGAVYSVSNDEDGNEFGLFSGADTTALCVVVEENLSHGLWEVNTYERRAGDDVALLHTGLTAREALRSYGRALLVSTMRGVCFATPRATELFWGGP